MYDWGGGTSLLHINIFADLVIRSRVLVASCALRCVILNEDDILWNVIDAPSVACTLRKLKSISVKIISGIGF